MENYANLQKKFALTEENINHIKYSIEKFEKLYK